MFRKFKINHLKILLFVTLFSFPFYSSADNECSSCHEGEVKQWEKSHHSKAMNIADNENTLGDFDNKTLQHDKNTVTFKNDDSGFLISMPDEKGNVKDVRVEYVFGFFPLQQYMFSTGNGKVQFFPYAWDSREKSEGGQRWFVLHPEQQPHDEFHFTQMGQNWNHMCADCHSSDFEKGFDLATKSYHSTSTEINVGCASCHGDSDKHLAWAKGDESIENKGYEKYIGTKTPLFQKQEDGSMAPITELKHSDQVQVCATCHARRSQLSDRDGPHSFHDTFEPALLTPELYHVDGQIWDENYVWGSFVQSKMYAQGVTCSNCHNPHSGELKHQGNQTCTQCHASNDYDTPDHHGHKVDTAGSQCVDCHMPATTYMQVDPRRDHSFRVPRPDLSDKTGAPNACIGCHEDNTNSWATNANLKWHPDSEFIGSEHFSQAFHAADQGLPNASQMLTKIAQNKDMPDIIRASALSRMANYPDRNTVVAIVRSVRDEEPLKRQAAIEAASGFAIAERYRMLKPLLTDKHMPVRAAAARELAPILMEPFPNNLKGEERDTLETALEEYREGQRYQADRGFSHTNLGNLAVTLGELKEAEQHFKTAIDIEPIFIPAYVNLADLYRQQNNETKAQQVLQQGLAVNDEAAALHYALAMSLIRHGDKQGAVKYLENAASSPDTSSNYIYTYALLLQDLGQTDKALSSLEKAFKMTPNNPDISYTLSQLYSAKKQYAKALRYAEHLNSLVPGNQQIQQMVEQLQMMSRLNP